MEISERITAGECAMDCELYLKDPADFGSPTADTMS